MSEKSAEPKFIDLDFHQVAKNEQLPRAEAFFELLNMRRTVREYSLESVPFEIIEKAILTAGTAPSGANMQPWRFVVCDKVADESSWQNALAVLVEKNRRWAKNAPILILAVAMENFNHNGQPNRWAMYDTGAASVSLCLQATALGMCVHQMGGFDAENAREVFNLPADCRPMSMMAVGYQAKVEILDDEFKEAELASRSRASLNERFYVGQWGRGIE